MTGEILMHPPCAISVIGTSHEENITAKQTKEESANQCRKMT
jgi:hypothetical protein